jgi:hypothetical protein
MLFKITNDSYQNIMVKLYLCLIIGMALPIIAPIGAFAQEKAVPAPVKRNMKKLFSSAQSITWYVEDNYYEAQFLDKKKLERIAQFSKSDGNLIEVRTLIEEHEIPRAIIGVLEAAYPYYVLREFQEIYRSPDYVLYNITFQTSKGIFIGDFAESGEIINITEAAE